MKVSAERRLISNNDGRRGEAERARAREEKGMKMPRLVGVECVRLGGEIVWRGCK